MDTDIAISVRNVAKKFRLFSSPKERMYEALHPFRKQYHREFWALNDVSFDVRRGEIVGILGRNGSGKSTLLQIVCSVMQATRGEVEVNGRISALLELGAGFNPEFTGRENVILNGAIMGISRKDMLDKLPEIESFADIGEFFDQPVKTYSSGMYVRVAFAAAINVDPEILIVDEALSVGDAKFQHRCFERIRNFMEQGKTILVVSHATETLLRICDRGVVIDSGDLKYIGPIKEAINYYQNLLSGSEKTDLLSEINATSGLSTSIDTKLPVDLATLTIDSADVVSTKQNYNKHETRLGNQIVNIIDFVLVVDGEVNPGTIRKQANVELFIKMYFQKTVEAVSIGFAIVTVDGTYIFGTNLEMLNVPFFSGTQGECVIVKFIWKSHVSGGEHFLNIGCHTYADGAQQFLDIRRSVAKLNFAPTPESIGFVNLELDFELLDK